MKKIISVIIGLIIILGIGSTVFASDISQALYYGIIRATNTGALAENVAVNVSINTPSWIANGFINSSVNNTAIRVGTSDVAFQPGYDTNPWIVYYDSIEANTSSDARLYTNTTGGEMRYFPGSGGMTTNDHASLELGDNFTITLTDVWIDTTAGASKYIWYKTDAIELYVDAATSGKVTLEMSAAGSLSPTSYTDVSGTWLNETLIYDGNTGTFGYANIADGNWSDYIILTRAAVYTDTISIDWRNSANIDDSDIDVYYESAWHDLYNGNISSDTWVNYDIGSVESVTQVRVKVHRTGGAVPCIDELVFQREIEANINLTGISSGEYDITVTADRETDNLTFDIGGTSDSTTLYNGVIDNANDIISFENDTILYAGSQEMEVDGVQKQFVEWEYGTTFTDQSGNSNDATPTFRTTSSDADVSASLISFQPISEASVDSETASTWPMVMEDPPELPDTTFTEESRPGIFFEPIIHALATATSLPDSLFWYNFAFVIIIGAGIIVYYILAHRKEGSAGTSGLLFVKILTQAAFMCFFTLPGLNVYGYFVPLYYLFFASGILVLSRDYGW